MPTQERCHCPASMDSSHIRRKRRGTKCDGAQLLHRTAQCSSSPANHGEAVATAITPDDLRQELEPCAQLKFQSAAFAERWVFFKLARSGPASMLSSVNQQHQNSPNPLDGKVGRLVEAWPARLRVVVRLLQPPEPCGVAEGDGRLQSGQPGFRSACLRMMLMNLVALIGRGAMSFPS